MLTVACTAAPTLAGRPASCASARRPAAAQRLPSSRRQVLARAEGEGSSEQQTAPPPAATQQQQQPPAAPQEEDPIWVRREKERAAQKGGNDLPFGAYLLFSSFTAIAAVGSIFEYANQRPIFDVIYPDSPLYAPILGFFAVTGLPTAGFLFYRAVSAANAEAERLDKLDGY